MQKILFIFILLFNSYNSFAQSNLKSEHISLEQGVSNNLIYSIYQDSKGFLWFGTMFGLVRYDGIKYKTYRYDPLDTNSLSNDDVISIYEDKQKNLWVGTYNGGLNKYDRAGMKFTRYLHKKENPNSISSNTVWDISQDIDGAMWFATEGGGLSSLQNGNFITYKSDSAKQGSISGNNIRSLAIDKEGNIWAGTMATGLNKFNKGKNSFNNFRFDGGNGNNPENNFIATVFEDSKGELWAGGGGGLYKFDKIKDEFERVNPPEEGKIKQNEKSDLIFSIGEDSPGVLLTGTQKGFYKFYVSTGKFEKIYIHGQDTNKKEVILAFVKDRSGIMWVSSYLDGLYKLYDPEEKFGSLIPGYNVKCILEDKEKILWAGTEKGLLRSMDGGKSFYSYFQYKNDLDPVSSENVNSIAEDNVGDLWIGTNNGLSKLRRKENQFQKFHFDPENKNSIGSNNVLKVFFEREEALWIGTDNGLDKFDIKNNIFTHYRHSDKDSNSLSENTILSIYEDKQNELWIGTYSGLNRIDRETGNFIHYTKDPFDAKSISNNYVFSFCEDNNNNFWVGTGGGLNIYDRNTNSFFNFNERDGLPNSVIAGIGSSADGSLWLSTYKGISHFNLKKKEFKNYDSEDGLLTNMFNNGSYFKNTKDEIFFGGINGINYISSAGIKQSMRDAPVILTSLVKYDDKAKKEIDISFLSEITLSHKENLINISFASLDFTNPKKNKFSHMLEGFDVNWISSSESEAIYTNLNPGEYIFRVKGTNSDGVWNENESSIKIIITPPFWKTWWFYILLICILSGIIMLIQNYFVRKKVKHLIEIENIRTNERELMREQASRDYHDELGHKLTRISLYSRRINKKLRPTANGLTGDLNNIVETSNSLQSGAKDLIWAMNPQEDSLSDLAVRLKNFGYELFESTGINFSSNEISEGFSRINLSIKCKRHIVFIFKEGMNNILKYSRCSEVKLNFELKENFLEIILEDNGIGFDINNCPKGYGLKNIYSRAKQINADVEIYSEKKTGTVIRLRSNNSNLILA